MRRNPSTIITTLFLVWAGISCNTVYQTTTLQYKTYRVGTGQRQDSAIGVFLQPYREQVDRTMNGVLGVNPENMDKKQPESTLGNFMTDAYYTMAMEKYNTRVDLAFMNYGGIRLNQLPAGNITVGKIFELMPFDNLLVLQKVKGKVLQQVLDLAASKGGWPVTGLSMQIQNNKAVNVIVGGRPLDPEADYTIVNSDFLANGGDNLDMLRSIPQISNGYLMRDALMDYIRKLNGEGKKIGASIENRVTYAQ